MGMSTGSNTNTNTNTIDTSGTIYVFNPQANMFVPYRPDFSGGIPVNDFNVLQQQRMSKQRAPVRDNQMGIIVPLIRIQPRQSDWAQLASVAQRYPRVNTVAIVSPSQDTRGLYDEPGPDVELGNSIRFLQNSSVIVLGYMGVNSDETLDNQRAEIERWRNWYPEINGLYLDVIGHQNDYRDVESLASYAKVDKGFRYVFANLTSSTAGGVVNRADDFVSQMKGVDTFVIYEREGYPSDAWYASIKKDWMSQYPRSKFAFVVYRVGPETLDCRSFIDKCVGIEKIGGYVYVQPLGAGASAADRRKMIEWTNISPLTEVCLNQLSTQAITESIPAVRGVTPQSTVIDYAQRGDAGLEGGKGSESKEETPETITRESMEFDKFGVRKIYPSAPSERGGGIDWYMFAENPRADVSFKNLPKRLIKQDDGSWSTDDKQVSLETWSPNGRKFLNVEITGYFKALKMPSSKSKNNKYLIQQYASRGGGPDDNSSEGEEDTKKKRNKNKNKNKKSSYEGSGYNGRLFPNGTVSVVKEIQYGAYTGNRGTTQATTKPLDNRWVGMKTVICNYNRIIPNRTDGKYETFVAMEIWIDDNVTDESGNLVVRNDWKHVMTMNDEGGWFVTQKHEKTKKKMVSDDTVLTMPGGIEEEDDGSSRNYVSWAWGDDAKVAFKHLSVREIERIARD